MIVGLDVGGTNIDLVLFKDKEIVKTLKYPLENDLNQSVLSALFTFLKGIDSKDIKQINLSTTLTTNLITTSKLDDVGLILQTGPGLPDDYYKINNHTYFISGYSDHQGIKVSNYSLKEIDDIKSKLLNQNIKDIGIVSKFSTRNFSVENELKELLVEDFRHINLGHNMSGRLNFKRRINTTFLNISIYETFNQFLNSISSALVKLNINAPVYILKADGGTMTISEAAKKPVESILSGPAASLQGINANYNIKEDSILIDIGGTTTDIFVYSDDNYLFEPLGAEIGKYKTLVRAIYTKSFALGGDTTIKISDGKITIGPKRKDKPYSLGGKYLTLTDCFVYLGKTTIGDIDLAKEIIDKEAEVFGKTSVEFSNLVIEEFVKQLKLAIDDVIKTVNNKIIYTIRELIENKQIVPKNIYGIGATFLLLEDSLKKKTNYQIYSPKESMVANAIGAALSKITDEITLYIDTSLKQLVIPELGINERFNQNITLYEAEVLASEYLFNYYKGRVSKEDILILESEAFNKIEGYYRSGKRILVKVGLIPSLIFKLEGENDE